MGQLGETRIGETAVGGGAGTEVAVEDVSATFNARGDLDVSSQLFTTVVGAHAEFYGAGSMGAKTVSAVGTSSVALDTSVDTNLTGFPFAINERIVLKVPDTEKVKNISLTTVSDKFNVEATIQNITRNPDTGEIIIDVTFTVTEDVQGATSDTVTTYVQTDFDGTGTVDVQSTETTSFVASDGTTYTDPDNDGTFTTDDGDTVSTVSTTTSSESLSTSTDYTTTNDPEYASSPDVSPDYTNSGGTTSTASGNIDTINQTVTDPDTGETVNVDPYPVTFTQRICTTFVSLEDFKGVDVSTSSQTNPIEHEVLSVVQNPADQPQGTVCVTVRISLLEPQGIQETPALFTLVIDYNFGQGTSGGYTISEGVIAGYTKGFSTATTGNQFGLAIGSLKSGLGL